MAKRYDIIVERDTTRNTLAITEAIVHIDEIVAAPAAAASAVQSATDAASSSDRAQRWAESAPPPDPADPSSRSAKSWAAAAEDSANRVDPRRLGSLWCAAAGSANALTASYGGVTPAAGLQIRFRAANTNTGPVTINLDGSGAIACRTITGVALPAGYIRTGVDTVATFDGTYWVLDRQIERGSNENGTFVRHADGTLTCARTFALPAINIPHGAVYFTDVVTAAFPAAFIARPAGYGSVQSTVNAWINARAVSTTGWGFSAFSGVMRAVGDNADLVAIGRWY